MKVKVKKSSKKEYWYNSDVFPFISEVREIKFTKPVNKKFIDSPIEYLKILFEATDKELSGNGVEYIYDWRDIRIVSLW